RHGCEQLQELRTHLRREAAEGQFLDLLPNAGDVVRVAVAHAADRDAGDEVDVLVPVLVGQPAAAAASHREPRVEREGLQPRGHVAALFGEDLLRPRAYGVLFLQRRHSWTPTSTWPRKRAARYEAMRSE